MTLQIEPAAPPTSPHADAETLVREASHWIHPLRSEIGRYLIGQNDLVDRLLISLMVKGHILLEGVPGLAKTLALKTLACLVNAKFNRIQFTPDMLPADIVGTEIYDPREARFRVKHGPVFANFILADEINRAPAKVQSALLEAMQEKQVTIGEQSYPTEEEELRVLDLAGTTEDMPVPVPIVSLEAIQQARTVVNNLYLDDKVKRYIVRLVHATRRPDDFGIHIAPLIRVGASPRATINLALTSRAHAFLNGRAYVTPHDVKNVAMDVLRHRVTVTYEAEAEGLDSEKIITRILDELPVP